MNDFEDSWQKCTSSVTPWVFCLQTKDQSFPLVKSADSSLSMLLLPWNMDTAGPFDVPPRANLRSKGARKVGQLTQGPEDNDLEEAEWKVALRLSRDTGPCLQGIFSCLSVSISDFATELVGGQNIPALITLCSDNNNSCSPISSPRPVLLAFSAT